MVDTKIVEYVANLARINISEEEKKRLVPQLSKIVDYIDKLKELDVRGIEPTKGAVTEENVFRPDKAKLDKTFIEILRNAPSQENKHFKVPKVIE